MGLMDWVRREWGDIKGNAKWDLYKVVGAAVIASGAYLVHRLKYGPDWLPYAMGLTLAVLVIFRMGTWRIGGALMSMNLTSVNAKLERAEQHLQALQDELVLWMAKEQYTISPQVNADSTRYSLIAHRVGTEPPLQRWTLMAGDCIHNLRCALDHLVYSIAVHEHNQDPPPDEKKLMFPITSTALHFMESHARIKALSTGVQSVIESVQPYNRPHSKLPPLLGILSDLENIDKHRLLRLAYASISEADIELAGIQSPAVKKHEEFPYAGEIVDGTEVFAISFDSSNPGMTFVKRDLDLAISMWHGKKDSSDPEWHDRNEVYTFLKLMATEVREVVDIVVKAVK